MLQTASFTRRIGCMLCFGCQMFKKRPLKLGRMYQTAHQSDGFNALRLYCSNLSPACLCYDSKPAKLHKARWAIHLLGLPNRASLRYTFKSDQAQWHLSRSSSALQNRKYFEYFFCFHRTLGISPKDLEGFRADIAFIYTVLACSLAISTNLNFDLTFATRNFIGSCAIKCEFWLVSTEDDCLEHVLRKSFRITKLINTLFLHLLN